MDQRDAQQIPHHVDGQADAHLHAGAVDVVPHHRHDGVVVVETPRQVDDLGIEDGWRTSVLNLTGFANVTLMVELESNSGSESLYLDNIVFKTGIPTPGSLALIGLSGLAATRRRR